MWGQRGLLSWQWESRPHDPLWVRSIFQRVRVTLLIAPSIQRMMALSLPVCFKQNSEEPLWPLPRLHLGRSSVGKRVTSCSRLYHRHRDCGLGADTDFLTSSEEPFSTLNLPALWMAPSASLEISWGTKEHSVRKLGHHLQRPFHLSVSAYE